LEKPCSAFRKHREHCKHLALVLAPSDENNTRSGKNSAPLPDLDEGNGKIRRPPALYYLPDGRGYRTVQNNTKEAQPPRSRELLQALISLLLPCKQEPWPAKSIRKMRRMLHLPVEHRPASISAALLVYAIVTKALKNYSWSDLIDALNNDAFAHSLGWPKSPAEPIKEKTLSKALEQIFPHPNGRGGTLTIVDILDEFIRVSALVAMRLDQVASMDATGLSKSLKSVTWRKHKYSSDSDSNVPDYAFIKLCIAAGMRCKLVVKVIVLLNYGKMTAEHKQFPDLFSALRATFKKLEVLVLDGAYYGQGLSEIAQRARVLLIVPQKDGADPANSKIGRDLMLLNKWLQDKAPQVYDFFYRLRANVEGIFSSNKRTNGHGIALRPRESEARFVIADPPPKMTGMSQEQKAAVEQQQLVAARSKVSIAQQAEIRGRILKHNFYATVLQEQLRKIEIDYSLTLNEAAGLSTLPVGNKRGSFDPVALIMPEYDGVPNIHDQLRVAFPASFEECAQDDGDTEQLAG
jgi:hypothetical protein